MQLVAELKCTFADGCLHVGLSLMSPVSTFLAMQVMFSYVHTTCKCSDFVTLHDCGFKTLVSEVASLTARCSDMGMIGFSNRCLVGGQAILVCYLQMSSTPLPSSVIE